MSFLSYFEKSRIILWQRDQLAGVSVGETAGVEVGTIVGTVVFVGRGVAVAGIEVGIEVLTTIVGVDVGVEVLPTLVDVSVGVDVMVATSFETTIWT